MQINHLLFDVAVTQLGSNLHVPTTGHQQEMLRITTENKGKKILLFVEGRLAGTGVGTLEQCWRELSAMSPKPKFQVDLCGVSFIDNTGKVLLKEMFQSGASFVAEGCLNQAIVREIGATKRKGETEEKRDPKRSTIIFYGLLFGLLSTGLANAQQPAPAQAPATPATPTTSVPQSGDVMRLTLEQAVALALKQNPAQQ